MVSRGRGGGYSARLLSNALLENIRSILTTYGRSVAWDIAVTRFPWLRNFDEHEVFRRIRWVREFTQGPTRGQARINRELENAGIWPARVSGTAASSRKAQSAGALVTMQRNQGSNRTYRNVYRRRKWRYMKKYPLYKSPRYKRDYMHRRWPNSVANYRKIILRQRVPIILGDDEATRKGLVTENGIDRSVMQFRVSVNPFTTRARAGTAKMFHACGPVKDTLSGAICAAQFNHSDYDTDIIDAIQRYGSLRVGAMVVTLHLYTAGKRSNGGSDQYVYKNQFVPKLITCGFDPYDNAPNNSGASVTYRDEDDPVNPIGSVSTHPPAITRAVMKRLPNYKEFFFMPMEERYADLGVMKKVLFRRRFPVSGGNETRQIQGAASNQTLQTVLPGQWDHRATYDSSYASALAVGHSSALRSGCLYVDVRDGPGTQADDEAAGELFNWPPAGVLTCIGFVETIHEIHVKNDLDSLGRPRT